jgi:hypothetical protein
MDLRLSYLLGIGAGRSHYSLRQDGDGFVRHAFGFILGLALVPALTYGMGWGYARSNSSANPIDHTISDKTQLYGALALMAAVGLFGGMITVARWASPLVSLIPALAFLGWTGWYLAAPLDAIDVVTRFPPAGELDGGLQVLLASGLFALVGFFLLVPSWTPERWRGRSRDDEEDAYMRDSSVRVDSRR